MICKECHIGIDTSNYTTSLAAVDDDFNVVFDKRIPLTVKKGDRGLRQSEALFQHMRNMPVLVEELLDNIDKMSIRSIGISSRPRSVDGSYMPVFNAGVDYGKIMGFTLGIPFYFFSHQEGHIEAVRQNSAIKNLDRFIALHLSGGTCEILETEYRGNRFAIKLIGGSKDLSFGQLIDRTGVAMGLPFPAGPMMDVLASADRSPHAISLKKARIEDGFFNISGLENQCVKLIGQGFEKAAIAYALFDTISMILCEAMEHAAEKTGIKAFLMAGGVASSEFIRRKITGHFVGTGFVTVFGDSVLSSDNAVGAAFLAAAEYRLALRRE